MALIVEGKMPTCCGLCCECLGGGSDTYYCNRAKRQISEVVPPYDKRMEWCPIIGEIPDEHGRLTNFKKISKNAEELAKFLGSYYNDNDCNYCAFHGTKECEESTCEKGLVAWLNSEVKE